MIKFLYFVIFITLGAYAQENALRNVPPSLRECYDNKYLLERDNRLPHTLNTLIAIIRKIENTEGLNMDLRSLSVALLHRFRQDGIVSNPLIPTQDGVTPYAPNSFQFFRHAQTLRFIQGNAISFPNNSITDVERCTLHFMFSNSIEIFQRGDEGRVCKFANAAYRSIRSVNVENTTSQETTNNDVETLSPDEIETISKHKDTGLQGTVDPNSLYPELPPNHPDIARMSALPPPSKCPVENGVIKTPYGPVSFGLVLAGIAAGTQPENVRLQDLEIDVLQKNSYPAELSVDNIWIATMAGDLAEIALIQGPKPEKMKIGASGNWNSTTLPRWYFLNSNEKLHYTAAEVRGDLDGLILGNYIKEWYSKVPSLRLSQVLDMYYSPRGLFDTDLRACNRRTLFTAVAKNETISAQAYSAAVVLNADIAKVTLEFSAIEKFAVEASNELLTYIPLSMNKDLSCADEDKFKDVSQPSVDLTIILDTKWPFNEIQSVLANLLDNLDINQYNSKFTLLNGYDGSTLMNTTDNILDFFAYNISHYTNATDLARGFDLPKTLEKLSWIQMDKMNAERERGVGGAPSDVVLIVTYASSISKEDKEYCLQKIQRMHEQVPDATLLILAYGSKDIWSEFVYDPEKDLFSIGRYDTESSLAPLTNLVSRIKQVPKRLINTQCGADYTSAGSSREYVDYVEPRGANFYKLDPNYFSTGDSDSSSTIKVQGSGADGLTVCFSRELLHANTTENLAAASCTSITNDAHTIKVACGDAQFIHECQPLYLAVFSNSTSSSYQCTDIRTCRFTNMIKYTISYENLICVSSTTRAIINPLILILALVYLSL